MPKYEQNSESYLPTTYYQIIGSKFTTKTTPQDANAVRRLNKNGLEVYEKHYAVLEGYLKDVKFVTTPYGKNIVLHLRDDEENMIVYINLYTGLAISIMRRLENVNLSVPIKISVFKSKEERTYISLRQDKRSIPQKYSNDDLPRYEEVFVRGTRTFDNSNAVNFLRGRIEEWAGAAFSAELSAEDEVLSSPPSPSSSSSHPIPDPLEDLPF